MRKKTDGSSGTKGRRMLGSARFMNFGRGDFVFIFTLAKTKSKIRTNDFLLKSFKKTLD